MKLKILVNKLAGHSSPTYYRFICPMCVSSITWDLDHLYVVRMAFDHFADYHRVDRALIKVKFKELKN